MPAFRSLCLVVAVTTLAGCQGWATYEAPELGLADTELRSESAFSRNSGQESARDNPAASPVATALRVPSPAGDADSLSGRVHLAQHAVPAPGDPPTPSSPETHSPETLPPETLPPAESVSSLEQLEAEFLQRHPAMLKAEAQVAAAHGKMVQMGLYPNPRFGYMAEEMGNDGAAGMQGGFVAQEWVRAGKLGLRQAEASLEMLEAQQHLFVVRQKLIGQLRAAYYDLLVAEHRVGAAEELVRVSKKGADAAKRLLDAREVGRTALLQAEVQLHTAEAARDKAQVRAQAARRTLAAVAGWEVLPPGLPEGDPTSLPPPLDWEDSWTTLRSTSPEISKATAGLERAQAAVARAEAEAVPNLDVRLAFMHNNGNGDDVTSLEIASPLPIFNVNQGNIARAMAEVVAAQQELGRVEIELRRQLSEALGAYDRARTQAAKMQNDILPKAKETLDLVSKAFAAGEIGYLEQLEAQRTYFQTYLLLFDALEELWRAKAEIDGLLSGATQPR